MDGAVPPFRGPVLSLLADDPHWAYVDHASIPFGTEFEMVFTLPMWLEGIGPCGVEFRPDGSSTWYPCTYAYVDSDYILDVQFAVPTLDGGHWRIRHRLAEVPFKNDAECWWPQQGVVPPFEM